MNDASNAIVEWSPDSGAALPAYLANAMGDMGTNIPERDRVPSLSYEGKVWQIVKDGDRTKLQHTNSDGDVVPVPVMRMVILNFNADRGRAYYEGEYDPSTTSAPKCWSADGKTPDVTVTDKQSATCANCPMSVKGSKIRDGKEMVACSAHRMIAIAPAFDLRPDTEPLRLKIAVTSDWDKEVVEHGWFAFRQYTDFLKSRGITHTGLVVTKVKFDNNVAYPKLLFGLDRILQPEEIAAVRQVIDNPKTADLLNEKWTAAGVDGVPANDSDIRPKPEDPSHIAHAGTASEVWWDGANWVAPWPTAPATPPATPAAELPPPPGETKGSPEKSGLEKAADDGWIPHPQAPGYHYKGQEVVADAELEARYVGNAPSATSPEPSAPASSPEPQTAEAPAAAQQDAPAPQSTTAPSPASTAAPDPMDAARADGWVAHPQAPGYHYKGQEVVADGELAARYQGNSSTSTSTPTGAGEAQASASGGDAAAQTAGEVPADVKNLLDKWTS